ncbi:hypothetical protein FACS1894163_04020 [Spirochaetia bacterium]|nr:hypothetical protein FACS1894163_04020 [Spirochaetia bacterium]
MTLQPYFSLSVPFIPIIGYTKPFLDTRPRSNYTVSKDQVRGREFDRIWKQGFMFP